MSEWVRVSKKNPCPICEKTDWCGVSSDGNVVHCQRTESDKPSRGNMGGWIHRLKDVQHPVLRRRIEKPTPAPTFDAEAYINALRNQTAPDQLDALGASLGVAPWTLDGLNASYSRVHQAWAFPMRNPDGRATGIRLRNDVGEKWSVKGSRHGLFYDTMLVVSPDRILYICEGPTDTAAAMTLGLPAVGRAACLGQVDEVRALCRRLGFNRIIVIADNDEAKRRPDGSFWYPGQEGARRLATEIKLAAKLILPPFKDLRDWLRHGATRQMIDCIAHQQVWRAA